MMIEELVAPMPTQPMPKYRIQLLAAISGQEEAAYGLAEATTKALRAAGQYVINPFELCSHISRLYDPNHYWLRCMEECLSSLCHNSVDLALAINDISASSGAQMELIAARKFNIATYQRYGGMAYLPKPDSAAMVACVLSILEDSTWQPANR